MEEHYADFVLDELTNGKKNTILTKPRKTWKGKKRPKGDDLEEINKEIKKYRKILEADGQSLELECPKCHCIYDLEEEPDHEESCDGIGFLLFEN